jgi:transglutaminase-like putative cysteine protease
MLIRAGYEIHYDCPAPVAMLLLLSVHPSREPTLQVPETLRVTPETPVHTFTDMFGNRCERLLAPAGTLQLRGDLIVEDSGLPDDVPDGALQHTVFELPDDVLVYLLGSRYCPVQELGELAWDLFGGVPLGWERVQAVCDWVHSHVRFDYQTARPTKTAWDVWQEQEGVCRDFTHLAITLCRCLNIPARYATGYLGDIGVPVDPNPMDFSAWFEVYLGGEWHTCDARHNRPRIGRILMARGRDAVDCALTTAFGAADLRQFTVWTDEITDPAATTSPA